MIPNPASTSSVGRRVGLNGLVHFFARRTAPLAEGMPRQANGGREGSVRPHQPFQVAVFSAFRASLAPSVCLMGGRCRLTAAIASTLPLTGAPKTTTKGAASEVSTSPHSEARKGERHEDHHRVLRSSAAAGGGGAACIPGGKPAGGRSRGRASSAQRRERGPGRGRRGSRRPRRIAGGSRRPRRVAGGSRRSRRVASGSGERRGWRRGGFCRRVGSGGRRRRGRNATSRGGGSA